MESQFLQKWQGYNNNISYKSLCQNNKDSAACSDFTT